MSVRISISQQIEEVEYELEQRALVYPRLIAKEPRRKSTLEYRVARMKAVLATLEWLRENEAAIRAGRPVTEGDAA